MHHVDAGGARRWWSKRPPSNCLAVPPLLSCTDAILLINHDSSLVIRHVDAGGTRVWQSKGPPSHRLATVLYGRRSTNDVLLINHDPSLFMCHVDAGGADRCGRRRQSEGSPPNRLAVPPVLGQHGRRRQFDGACPPRRCSQVCCSSSCTPRSLLEHDLALHALRVQLLH